MARVVYGAEAFDDLERIIDFMLETAPQSAGEVLDQIRSAVSILGRHPQIGRRIDVHR